MAPVAPPSSAPLRIIIVLLFAYLLGRCGVRLVNPENLEYHRNHCHDSKSNEFICPECAKNTEPIHFTGTWGKVCNYYWRYTKKLLIAQLFQFFR